MNNSAQYAKILHDFHKAVEKDINLIQQGIMLADKQNDHEGVDQMKKQLQSLIESIAQTGDTHQYDWQHLRSLIIIKTKDVLQFMQQKFPYVPSSDINETYQNELDVVLQFLCGFETKIPFTIQRICELILSPEKHYRSTRKIMFAFEKLVNVSQI